MKRLSLPDAPEASDATGYERGAITPFGSRGAWPVVADAGIADLGRVAIGGGGHGVNLHVEATDLLRALEAPSRTSPLPHERSARGANRDEKGQAR